MNNNSSTGGFLSPNPQPPVLTTVPPNLTLQQFIQTLLVGVSGFPGTLVRPDWQLEPPKEPDVTQDWLAYGIQSVEPDANGYEGVTQINDQEIPYFQRNELLQITLSVYGPNAYNNMGLIRDNLQLSQNLATLRLANIGYAYDSVARHAPDFINGRWNERYLTDIFFRRQLQRLYPVLNFVSAGGVLYTQTAEDQNFTQNFQVTGS